MSGRAILGGVFVAAVGVTLGILLADVPGARTMGERLWDHATRRMHRIEASFAERPVLKPGDPVYSVENQAFALHGRVVDVSGEPPWQVSFEVDPVVTRRFGTGTEVVAMNPTGDLAWVLRTLLPPPLRAEILQNLGRVWKERREETLAALKGPALALVGDLTSVLAETLPEAIRSHEEEREHFTTAFTDEIFKSELKPLLQEQFVARLEERLGPLAGKVGAEIREAVKFGDLLGVSWVATKDLFGASAKDEMATRLGKLIRERALPVIQRRAPEAFKEAVAAVKDGLADPSVREALDRAAWKTLDHPAFQTYAGAVLESWIIRNPRLADAIEAAFRSERLRRPLEDLYKAAEPELEKALEEMLTREDRGGMDHQLVRVLRHVVLKKDKHYLLLVDGGGGSLQPGRGVLSGRIGVDR